MNPTPNQAAKARDDLAAVAASQAELTEAWAALGVAKAAAKDAEVLVDKVSAAEGRIPPLVEAAVRQEASAAAAASKAAELREVASEVAAAVEAARAQLRGAEAAASPEGAAAAAEAKPIPNPNPKP